MSRSNPTPTNPSTRFFQWAGSTGKLSFYDKEKSENITVPLPFDFLVLDELATITGYSKRDESGYWSNEVRSVAKEEFVVRTKKGIAQTGLYKELTDVRAKGAKYTKSIYIAYLTKQGWQIGNIQASGSALSAWIEFSDKHTVQNGKVIMEKGSKQEAPTGDYYPPTFEYVSADEEENRQAIMLDRELQLYLNQYLTAPKDETIVPDEIDPVIGLASEEEIANYKERKEAKHTREWSTFGKDKPDKEQDDYNRIATQEQDVAIEEPINIDDIPF